MHHTNLEGPSAEYFSSVDTKAIPLMVLGPEAFNGQYMDPLGAMLVE